MTDNEKDVREESPVESETMADAEVNAGEVQPEEKPYEWKEPPLFEVEEKDNCLVGVKVTIPVANIKAALDDVYEEVNDGVQVPGFRRGKAPRKLLEKRLGKYARSTVVERLVDAASNSLVKEKDLKPISKVEVEGLEDTENIPEDKDLVYTLEFETSGTCEPADYTQFVLEKLEFQVEQADVDEAIEDMRSRFGRYEPLMDEGARDGDQVIMDFSGTIDGEPFAGNSAENYPYILGSKRFDENMEAVLRGAKSGDAVEADVPFSDDFKPQELAGKTAHFHIKVNEVKRRMLPEVNDEFAKKAGQGTLEELRESIRKRIAENADTQLADLLRNQAMQKLVEESAFILPKKQTQRFIDGEYDSIKEELVQQHVPVEEIEKEDADIRKNAEERGLFAIKSMYAINAICEKEGIDVSEADMDEYARSLSGGDDKQFELMKEFLAREDIRTNSVYRILTNKVLDAIVAKASIKLVPFKEEDGEASGGQEQGGAEENQDG